MKRTSRSFATVMSAFACLYAISAAAEHSGTARSSVDASVFDGIANEALATGRTPGFAFAVVRDGKVVYAKGFGLANVEHRVPVRATTPFAVGSITKQFTAASILLLAAGGKVSLDDSLAKRVPDFPNAASITLRMLLNQTAGLHNYPRLDEHAWPIAGTIPLAAVLSILSTDKPDFAPGTKWAYSNANYALLSAVIARSDASGDEGSFLERTVFQPLHLTGTGYGYAAQHTFELATPYDGTKTFAPQDPISLDLFSGAGALVSTAPDIATWDIALMRGTLLDTTARDELWRPGRLADGAVAPYAMGFVPATLAGHREVWHNGLAPGAGGYCYNALFPDEGLAIVILANGAAFQGVPERMVTQVVAAYDAASAPAEDPAVTELAKEWFHRLKTGTVDLSRVTSQFAERLTPDFLEQVRVGLASGGDPTDWAYLGSNAAAGAVIYNYSIRIDGASHIWSVGITPDRKIAGSSLR